MSEFDQFKKQINKALLEEGIDVDANKLDNLTIKIVGIYKKNVDAKLQNIKSLLQASNTNMESIKADNLYSYDTVEPVKKFLQGAGKEVPTKQIEPDENTKELIINLIFEELMELAEALGNDGVGAFNYLCRQRDIEASSEREYVDYEYNPTEVLDALVDIQVVLNNAILFTGMHTVLNKAYRRVMTANLSKVQVPETYAYEIAEYYSKNGTEAFVTPNPTNPNYFVILRKSDNKILKPMDFRHPQFTDLIDDTDYGEFLEEFEE